MKQLMPFVLLLNTRQDVTDADCTPDQLRYRQELGMGR